MNKILLVSSDGDYKKLVDYLINKDKFIKILFPSRQASSLYKKLGALYYDYLGSNFIREKIAKEKANLGTKPVR